MEEKSSPPPSRFLLKRTFRCACLFPVRCDTSPKQHGRKERIFERGIGRNTGFGLAISREILDITGLGIRESGEAGRGARFEVTAPKQVYRTR